MNSTTHPASNVFRFGADYYPEQWPEERWPIDAQLMAEAGFNVVRLAEFAWAKMESVPDHYTFAWLDRIIGILSERGIAVVLGTPTASPPAWLMHRHPDVFRVLETGVRQTYGNRRNYCPNNPTYHRYTQHIVKAMADHYKDHPSIIAWQIDNEFGQGDRCCCPVCITAFHEWLKAKYQTLDAVNDAWGTIFWSHSYSDWVEIPAPLKTADSPNPGLALDYYRFSAASYVAYQKMQIDVLREAIPNARVTHNLMGWDFGQLDYFKLAKDLDFVAWDNYPRTQWSMEHGLDKAGTALAHDTMRGLKRQNFWVMEQQSGSGGWEIVSSTPRPGENRLWAYQAVAHGADGIVFFRWRTARFGTEQYWHGILDHHARLGRRYDEIKKLGHEISRIGSELFGSISVAEAAILHSYDTRFAFQIQANNPNFRYTKHIKDVYQAFYQANVPIDVLADTADLMGYKLVTVPALYILSDEVAANLQRFVAEGGTLVITPCTGVKDEQNAVVNMPLPGLLTALCGAEVSEYDSLPTGFTVGLAFTKPEANPSQQTIAARVWCDVLAPSTAEVVAIYTDGYYSSAPAITINRYGKGSAIMIGTWADSALYSAILPWVLQTAALTPLLSAPEGVEMTLRRKGSRRFMFVLNHTDQPQLVVLSGQNLLNGQMINGSVEIAAKDVLILEE